ncbi:MAG: hypothetical protein ACREEL_01305 [Stellaceae bacterium]
MNGDNAPSGKAAAWTRHLTVAEALLQDGPTRMAKIDIVAASSFYPPVLAALIATYAVHRLDQAADRAAFLVPLGNTARGIATFQGKVDATLMDALPRLKIVASR